MELKQSLEMARQAMAVGNFMWELEHPFPYNAPNFIETYHALLQAVQMDDGEGVLLTHRLLKAFLQPADFEYIVWQEWKEGFARLIENRIQRLFNLPENHYGCQPPYHRITLYEGGAGVIAVLSQDTPAPINAFHKSPNCVIGQDDTMVLPDVPASIFEGEAELALVIGKRARNVRAADAMGYIFGYTNFIDGSARGLPPAGNTFYQMKSRETFGPMGPFLVTADEVPDPHKLQVRLWNNGVLKQNFNTSDMAHKIPRCIEWVSSIHTLEPGDVLATGTNHRGLNSFMDGDRIELEVEGMGRLRITVKDDLKRTWSRETRLEHATKGGEGVSTPQLTGKYAPPKK